MLSHQDGRGSRTTDSRAALLARFQFLAQLRLRHCGCAIVAPCHRREMGGKITKSPGFRGISRHGGRVATPLGGNTRRLSALVA
jgi:hypothetical protein